MPLTDTMVRNAKPGQKAIRLKDDRGLYLEVTPAGGKLWRLRYWLNSRENRISLGGYPDVSLKDARQRRDEARKLIANGIDPSEVRKAEKTEAVAEGETVELVGREWHDKFKTSLTERSAAEILHRLERDVFPWIGAKPIKDVTAPELLAVVRRIESRGAPETARRCLQYLSRIGRYAVATGRAERDTAADLRGCILPASKRHFSSLTNPKDIAALLRSIDAYQGSLVVLCALRLASMTFVRPGELRKAEWTEFNFEESGWRIPAERMKMKEQHIVPLSRQAVAILRELHPLTGSGKYVFPSIRSSARPMSENTVNGALRRMG